MELIITIIVVAAAVIYTIVKLKKTLNCEDSNSCACCSKFDKCRKNSKSEIASGNSIQKK